MRTDWTVSSTSGAFMVTAGALRLNNLAADTFAFECPAVGFNVGDPIHVRHCGRLVFSGRVYAAEDEFTRGSTAGRKYTARGPWQILDDLIYRQQWMAMGVSGPAAQFYSRVILNQTMLGAPMLLEAQLRDILAPAAAAGGLAVGTVSVPAVYLPADEQRSITLAQALMRCMRLFPALAAWFDYSGAVPVMNIGAGAEAAWMDDPGLRKTMLTEVRAGAPPAGVVLEIETTGEWDGNAYRKIDVQAEGDVADGRKVLYIPLELQGASGSVTTNSLDVETEDIPPDWETNKQWWKEKHPRLANVSADYLKLKDAARTGELPRLAKTPMKDVEAAGLRAELDTFTVKATIPTLDDTNSEVDVERDVLLMMKFVTTSAVTKKYTWVDSSAATGGEWIPDGLAEAVLAQHARDGESLGVVARPDASWWAVPGQTRGGLVCQGVGYNLASDLMDAEFGPPEQLSAQDLAGLMTGWRNRRRATSSYSRETGRPEADAEVDHSAVAPVEATDSSDGKKSIIGAFTGAHKATIDPSKLPDGNNVAEMREVRFVTEGEDGEQRTVKAHFLVNKVEDDGDGGKDGEPGPCGSHPGGGTAEGGTAGGGDGGAGGGGGGGENEWTGDPSERGTGGCDEDVESELPDL